METILFIGDFNFPLFFPVFSTNMVSRVSFNPSTNLFYKDISGPRVPSLSFLVEKKSLVTDLTFGL